MYVPHPLQGQPDKTFDSKENNNHISKEVDARSLSYQYRHILHRCKNSKLESLNLERSEQRL